jgi:quinol monooxygenase YgiN
MIVRVWEAEVKPGKTDRLLDVLKTKIVPRLAATNGFVHADIIRSVEGAGEDQILVISRWRDEQAIAAYAGPLWRIRAPLVDFEVADYLARPTRVRHYLPVGEQEPLVTEATAGTASAETQPE